MTRHSASQAPRETWKRRVNAERSVKGISAGTLDALVEQLALLGGRAALSGERGRWTMTLKRRAGLGGAG